MTWPAFSLVQRFLRKLRSQLTVSPFALAACRPPGRWRPRCRPERGDAGEVEPLGALKNAFPAEILLFCAVAMAEFAVVDDLGGTL